MLDRMSGCAEQTINYVLEKYRPGIQTYVQTIH